MSNDIQINRVQTHPIVYSSGLRLIKKEHILELFQANSLSVHEPYELELFLLFSLVLIAGQRKHTISSIPAPMKLIMKLCHAPEIPSMESILKVLFSAQPHRPSYIFFSITIAVRRQPRLLWMFLTWKNIYLILLTTMKHLEHNSCT